VVCEFELLSERDMMAHDKVKTKNVKAVSLYDLRTTQAQAECLSRFSHNAEKMRIVTVVFRFLCTFVLAKMIIVELSSEFDKVVEIVKEIGNNGNDRPMSIIAFIGIHDYVQMASLIANALNSSLLSWMG
jgi:hypothetical protein